MTETETESRDLFLWGPLGDPALIRVVAGRDIQGEQVVLGGFHLVTPADWPAGFWPVPVARPRAALQGLLLRAPAPEVRARLAFFAAATGLRAQEVTLAGAAGDRAAIWLPPPHESLLAETDPEATPWSPGGWAGRDAALVATAAGDIMRLFGLRDPEVIRARYGQILVRAASRLRAAWPAPATRRHFAREGDVDVVSWRQPYAHFFAVEEYDLRFRRFDGSMSPEVNRAVFISGDAVTVLPYDPLRDRVLLVEQFRAGPWGRGDPQPWQPEAVAGRIDPGETPEEAARREAVEEAGLALGRMELVGGYYPSPGAKSEYIWSYVALCDLPDGVAGVFGMEGEAEDIRGHLLGYDEFSAMLASGEIDNGPLLVTAFWLQRERQRLRAQA